MISIYDNEKLSVELANIAFLFVPKEKLEGFLNVVYDVINDITEDDPSRYQTTLEVQAEYLKELNKYSKEKSWEEGQSQSGLFMWLGMKLQQEDNDE